MAHHVLTVLCLIRAGLSHDIAVASQAAVTAGSLLAGLLGAALPALLSAEPDVQAAVTAVCRVLERGPASTGEFLFGFGSCVVSTFPLISE